MGTRLFEELESLRDLNERQELEKAKTALEESGRQKDLLLKDLDHRIKNSLQIVASLLYLHAKTAGPAAGLFRDAAARVTAIAAVHQQLHTYDDVGTVLLDRYLVDHCQGIAAASSGPNRAWPIVVDAEPLQISANTAIPLALIVNELVTNAIQHARPVGEGQGARVMLRCHPDSFSISVSDPGDGPVSGHTKAGLGTTIVESLCEQINAKVEKERSVEGYAVTVIVPHRRAS
jgi:two-component sensor histidine kinase